MPSNPTPRLHIEVSASLTLSNGTQVEVNEGDVVLHKPGPQGGSGHRIVIPRKQWPTIVQAVESVQGALQKAEAVKQEVEQPVDKEYPAAKSADHGQIRPEVQDQVQEDSLRRNRGSQ